MKITIHSRRALEKRLETDNLTNAAIISFYDPAWHGRAAGTPVNVADKCRCAMQIALHDLDPEALAEVHLTKESYFPEATDLAAFIENAWQAGLEIICQCEYGQSRSAGCAAAILQHYTKNGIDIFADYRYYPNQLVYHKVYDALQAQKKHS